MLWLFELAIEGHVVVKDGSPCKVKLMELMDRLRDAERSESSDAGWLRLAIAKYEELIGRICSCECRESDGLCDQCKLKQQARAFAMRGGYPLNDQAHLPPGSGGGAQKEQSK